MSRPGFPDFKNALSGLIFIRQNAAQIIRQNNLTGGIPS